MELEELKTENVRRDKEEKLARDKKLTYISLSAAILFMVFFAFLYKLLEPWQATITAAGVGIQGITVVAVMMLINHVFCRYCERLPILKNRAVAQMLQVYALICIIVALVSINQIPLDLLALAP